MPGTDNSKAPAKTGRRRRFRACGGVVWGALSLLTAAAVWWIVKLVSGYNDALLPSPVAVWRGFLELAADGTLWNGFVASMARFAAGYFAAVILGVSLGFLLGKSRTAFRLANPVVQILRPIAPVAWLPFLVLLVGIGDPPAIIVIFLAGFFAILQTTAAAVRQIPPVYSKVARNYGISRVKELWKITLPAVFPSIANSLHLALGSCWIFLVSGEMVGSQSGLGFLVIDARNNLRTDHLLAVMIVIGLVGFALDWLVGAAEARVKRAWGDV